MRSNWKLTCLFVALAAGCSTPSWPSAKKPATNDFGALNQPVQQASWTEKVTAPFKSDGTPKPAAALNTKSDPISLQFASSPPSAALYLSMGQMSDQGGNADQARALYEKALAMEPKNTDCLLALARLEDRQGNLPKALQIYQQAVNTNPNDARALNDLALCHARNGQLDASLQLLHKVVQMRPDKQLYRNNIAKVWIEKNRLDLASKHLKAVYEPAAANYNMAVLLQQRGRTAEAISYLNLAVTENPQMQEAQKLLASLNGTPPQQPKASNSAIQVSKPAIAVRAPASNDDILPTPMFPAAEQATQYPSTGAHPLIPQPQSIPAETASVPVGNSPLMFPPVH